MAVSKRTRFEVLRRDEHTCQYCGGKAPDVTLQIDHVMPVSLGGSDKPDNLLAACKDCNVGKASIAPDSPLVQRVGAEAAAYVLGMQDKMTRFRSDIESLEECVETFDDLWNRWQVKDESNPLPGDYHMALFKWKQMGVPTAIYELAIPVAMEKWNRERYMSREDIFPYMIGVVRNMINEREIDYSVTAETAAVYTENEADEIRVEAYERGWSVGCESAIFRMRQAFANTDIVAHHIDGTTTPAIDDLRVVA